MCFIFLIEPSDFQSTNSAYDDEKTAMSATHNFSSASKINVDRKLKPTHVSVSVDVSHPLDLQAWTVHNQQQSVENTWSKHNVHNNTPESIKSMYNQVVDDEFWLKNQILNVSNKSRITRQIERRPCVFACLGALTVAIIFAMIFIAVTRYHHYQNTRFIVEGTCIVHACVRELKRTIDLHTRPTFPTFNHHHLRKRQNNVKLTHVYSVDVDKQNVQDTLTYAPSKLLADHAQILKYKNQPTFVDRQSSELSRSSYGDHLPCYCDMVFSFENQTRISLHVQVQSHQCNHGIYKPASQYGCFYHPNEKWIKHSMKPRAPTTIVIKWVVALLIAIPCVLIVTMLMVWLINDVCKRQNLPSKDVDSNSYSTLPKYTLAKTKDNLQLSKKSTRIPPSSASDDAATVKDHYTLGKQDTSIAPFPLVQKTQIVPIPPRPTSSMCDLSDSDQEPDHHDVSTHHHVKTSETPESFNTRVQFEIE